MIHTIYIIGMLIAILGFILFLLAETRIRIIDKEIKKQDELHKSFMKAKQNDKNRCNYVNIRHFKQTNTPSATPCHEPPNAFAAGALAPSCGEANWGCLSMSC